MTPPLPLSLRAPAVDVPFVLDATVVRELKKTGSGRPVVPYFATGAAMHFTSQTGGAGRGPIPARGAIRQRHGLAPYPHAKAATLATGPDTTVPPERSHHAAQIPADPGSPAGSDSFQSSLPPTTPRLSSRP